MRGGHRVPFPHRGRPRHRSSLKRYWATRWPVPGRPPRHDLSTWTVPQPTGPILFGHSSAEIEVFEQQFGASSTSCSLEGLTPRGI